MEMCLEYLTLSGRGNGEICWKNILVYSVEYWNIGPKKYGHVMYTLFVNFELPETDLCREAFNKHLGTQKSRQFYATVNLIDGNQFAQPSERKRIEKANKLISSALALKPWRHYTKYFSTQAQPSNENSNQRKKRTGEETKCSIKSKSPIQNAK